MTPHDPIKMLRELREAAEDYAGSEPDMPSHKDTEDRFERALADADEVLSAPAKEAEVAQETDKDVLLDDLRILIGRLVRALRKAAPDHTLPDQAVDYMNRKGLRGNILRDPAPFQAAAQPEGDIDWKRIAEIRTKERDAVRARLDKYEKDDIAYPIAAAPVSPSSPLTDEAECTLQCIEQTLRAIAERERLVGHVIKQVTIREASSLAKQALARLRRDFATKEAPAAPVSDEREAFVIWFLDQSDPSLKTLLHVEVDRIQMFAWRAWQARAGRQLSAPPAQAMSDAQIFEQFKIDFPSLATDLEAHNFEVNLETIASRHAFYKYKAGFARALSRPAIPEGFVPTWKPIETAPKDGSEFLALCLRRGWLSDGPTYFRDLAKWSGKTADDRIGHFSSRSGDIVVGWSPVPAASPSAQKETGK